VDIQALSGTVRIQGNDHVTIPGKLEINQTTPSGSITSNLEVNGTAAKTGGGSWAVLSDSTVKTDIRSIHDAYTKVLNLNPVSFKFKDDYRNKASLEDRIYFGYIAQEYEKAFPMEVTHTRMTTGEDRLMITTDGALTYTTAAVQQLIKDNEQQAAQIAVLTGQINKLYELINKK
jgi:hypothetical protein